MLEYSPREKINSLGLELAKLTSLTLPEYIGIPKEDLINDYVVLLEHPINTGQTLLLKIAKISDTKKYPLDFKTRLVVYEDIQQQVIHRCTGYMEFNKSFFIVTEASIPQYLKGVYFVSKTNLIKYYTQYKKIVKIC